MKSKSGAVILSGIILVLTCVVIVLVISFFEFNSLKESNKMLSHTEGVILLSEKLLTSALNNETGSRGFIISGEKKFLEPLEKSESEIKIELAELREKIKTHPLQQKRVDSLDVYLQKRIAFSNKAVVIARQYGFDAAKKLVETGEGKLYTDHIRIYIDSIQNEENTKLFQRKLIGEKSAAQVNIILMFALLALLLLLVFSFKRLRAEGAAAKKEAEQKLFESDEKYRNIVETVPEGIWLLDKNNRTMFINSQFTEILGYDLEKAALITPFDFIINNNRKKIIEENVQQGIKEQFESTFVGNNEKAIWILVEINPIIRNGIYEGSLVVTSDISQRKKAELLVHAETQVMSKIALNEPIGKILENIVLNIEASIDNSICSILLLNKDGKTVRHGAAPHLPAAYIKGIDGSAIGEGEGSCGTAAFRKEPVIVSDIYTDPLWKNYKTVALQFGLKACWSTPILSDDNKVLGTFAVYYKTPRLPEKNDFEAVQRATNYAKIAIEKNEASIAINESEQKYRTLVEQASDAIFIADTGGSFITVNSSAARLSQFTVDELLQKKFSDFAVIEDLDKNPFHFEELKAGKITVTERLMRRKDGSIIDIEVTAKHLTDGRLLVFVKDISERKKSEKAIKESEAKYRAFYENSMDGILIGSPDGLIYAANPAACNIYEKTEEELCAGGREGLADNTDPDFKAFLDERRKFGRARKEVMQKRKNGTLFPAEISSSIFTDAEGQLRTVIIIRDISQRVKANNDIIKEKNLSDSIINSLPGVFYLYSYDWKFIRWNKNFETRTGFTAAEIEKMHPLDFFSAEDRLDITEKIKNVFVNGEAKTETIVKTKSGEIFPYFLTGKLIDYEGKPSLLGIGFDISERLKAQEDVKQSNEQLRLLTAHLQQVREDERKRIAREIHDELGQQITAIKMDVAWLDKNIAEQNTLPKQKIKNIIQLLDLSNTSVRNILKELRMGVLDDYGLVEALQWLGRQFTSSTGIPVKFSSNETVLKAEENVAVCIFRVCQEALTNIAKHAAAREVMITVKKEDGFVKLSIKDDGKGFDPAVLKANVSFGILGVKERVAALKGFFEVETAPGKGTNIMVKIPLLKTA